MGVGTICRGVQHGGSEEMTFKPDPKLRKEAATCRPGGRMFWIEGHQAAEQKP